MATLGQGTRNRTVVGCMADSRHFVIVGGGIWGLSTAFHLATAGARRVTVLERNPELARETTPRAAGLVGQIRSTPVMMRAIQYALDLFTRFPAETGHDPGLHRTGSLLVALTDERMAAYERQVRRAHENKVEANFVSKDEMKRLSPHMDVGQLRGGFLVPGDGYLDPRQCALAYAAAARDQAVEIQMETSVTGFRSNGGRITGVETDKGPIDADAVFITAGPWTGILSNSAQHRLPMQPIRHQRVRTVPVEGIPSHHPVVRVTDVSCYVRPEQGGYLYGFFEPHPTPIELENLPAGFRTNDIDPPTETMSEARRRLAPIFPVLDRLETVQLCRGMTTFAPDGSYLIGPIPGIEGLFVATGCAALGIAGSAAVGRWLANWALRGNPGEDLSAFQLDRFGAKGRDFDWVKRESEKFYGSYYAIPPS